MTFHIIFKILNLYFYSMPLEVAFLAGGVCKRFCKVESHEWLGSKF